MYLHTYTTSKSLEKYGRSGDVEVLCDWKYQIPVTTLN